MQPCKKCGQPVKRKDKIFCSRECSSQFTAIKIKAKRKILICQICGKEYTIKSRVEEKTSKYCSKKCKDMAPRPQRKKTGEIKICKFCGKSFYLAKCFKNRQYCSTSCYSSDNRIEGVCLFCNKIAFVQKNRKKVIFCNKDCYTKWKTYQIGEKSINWKGGITPLNARERKRSEYRQWRNTIFTRDDFTCQKCRKRGIEINAHHIKPFSKYEKLRYNISNGITLCVECHKKEHHNAAINIALRAAVNPPTAVHSI
jgi:hypothetical protein